VKSSTKAGIDRYVAERVPTGSFIRAVLENNLREAFGRADDDNRADLFEIVCYCYNDIPAGCWGSPERVRRWLERADCAEEVSL
jgi:hypothetical protein